MFVCSNQAPSKMWRGHAPNVTALGFTFDNAWVISVGGDDCAVFKWRLCASDADAAVDASSKTVWYALTFALF
jgi:hypothetical protein